MGALSTPPVQSMASILSPVLSDKSRRGTPIISVTNSSCAREPPPQSFHLQSWGLDAMGPLRSLCRPLRGRMATRSQPSLSVVGGVGASPLAPGELYWTSRKAAVLRGLQGHVDK